MRSFKEWERVTVSRCLRRITEDDDPEDVTASWLKRDGEKIGYIIRWFGGEFESKSCWIKADADSVVDLEENL